MWIEEAETMFYKLLGMIYIIWNVFFLEMTTPLFKNLFLTLSYSVVQHYPIQIWTFRRD